MFQPGTYVHKLLVHTNCILFLYNDSINSLSVAYFHADLDLHTSHLGDVPASEVKATHPMKGGYVVRKKSVELSTEEKLRERESEQKKLDRNEEKLRRHPLLFKL